MTYFYVYVRTDDASIMAMLFIIALFSFVGYVLYYIISEIMEDHKNHKS